MFSHDCMSIKTVNVVVVVVGDVWIGEGRSERREMIEKGNMVVIRTSVHQSPAHTLTDLIIIIIINCSSGFVDLHFVIIRKSELLSACVFVCGCALRDGYFLLFFLLSHVFVCVCTCVCV